VTGPYPQRIGKYEIRGVLGRGGMGMVYHGYDAAIERSVAIKSITRSALDPIEAGGVLDRFRREAQAAGRLVHPNIVQVYEYGEDGDLVYIVMEFVDGTSLHQQMASGARPDLARIGEIVGALLDAVGYSHGQGVIHRDIKPSNILMSADGRVKISDFGIARVESSSLTQTGQLFGTPYYMSPEQFQGKPVDPGTDLYSVGVIAYELLTGKRPYSGSTPQIMRQTLDTGTLPVPPSQIDANISPGLEHAVMTALAKDPQERYRTAADFASEFRRGIDESLSMTGADGTGLAAPATPAAPVSIAGAARRIATLRRQQPAEPPPAQRGGAPAQSPAGEPARSPTATRPRLLVIDDEERILSALKSVFRRDYHVFATSDCAQALAFLNKYYVHAIISDQRMPAMPGVALLKEARRITPYSMRILLTGYADLAAIVGSINDGEIFRFVSKPWDNNELRSIVAEAVAIASALSDAGVRNEPGVAAGDNEPVEGALLVVEEGGELSRVARELVAGRCRVLAARNASEALDATDRERVSLLLCELDGDTTGDIAALLKVLKRERPGVLSIVVTSVSDSELVIELINQAQVFRFLNKPVNLRLLRTHLDAALAQCRAFERRPLLVSTQQPEPASIDPRTTFARRLADRLLGLLGRAR
jgi:serine/threonine-protein kinase